MNIVRKVGIIVLFGIVSNGVKAQEGGGKTRSDESKTSQETVTTPVDQPLKKGKKQLLDGAEKAPPRLKLPVLEETEVKEVGDATEVIKNSGGELEVIRKGVSDEQQTKAEQSVNKLENKTIKATSMPEQSPKFKNKKLKNKGKKGLHAKKGARKKKIAKGIKASKVK